MLFFMKSEYENNYIYIYIVMVLYSRFLIKGIAIFILCNSLNNT